jgi:predicted transcriptional regulator
MNTIELKNKLIDHIKASTDTELLEGLYNYLAQDESSREVYQLSEKQNLAIEEARAEYKRGEFTTDEQVNKEMEEWLSR